MRIKIIEIFIRLIRRVRRTKKRSTTNEHLLIEDIDITIPEECLVKPDNNNNNNGDIGVDYTKLGRWAIVQIRKLERRIERLEQMK